MQDEQPIQQSHLQVKTDLKALTEVLQWFEEKVSPLITQDVFWQCQVALAEGFTNAVRHAHQERFWTTSIDLEVLVFPNYLEMRIWDYGKPFDMLAKLQSLDKEAQDPLEKEGGRGLIFMQQLTDQLDYLRVSGNRNCLMMRKKI
jgi:serine/threonine-protein kinase RsbW